MLQNEKKKSEFINNEYFYFIQICDVVVYLNEFTMKKARKKIGQIFHAKQMTESPATINDFHQVFYAPN